MVHLLWPSVILLPSRDSLNSLYRYGGKSEHSPVVNKLNMVITTEFVNIGNFLHLCHHTYATVVRYAKFLYVFTVE